MDETTINVPLLRKTLDWAYEQHLRALRGEPSEWNQSNWIMNSFDTACGTACCIAGKIAIDAGWTAENPAVGGNTIERDGKRDFASEVGRRELGLTQEQADALFSGGNTIGRLYSLAGGFTDGEITAPPELDLEADDATTCRCGCGMAL